METSFANSDRRWQDLYKIGGVACFAVSALVVVAIIAYFIWPYSPTDSSTQEIFILLQDNLIGGLVSLDLLMPIIVLINLFPMLALYVALKEVNESYALIALVMGLIAVTLVIPARPLLEMAALSQKYSQATGAAERAYYLAAGESYRAFFDGTAWFVETLFLVLSGLISSILMLRSRLFTRTTAWLGIVTAVFGLGFFLPTIGLVLLFANTILTVPFYLLVGRVFIRLGWGADARVSARDRGKNVSLVAKR
jgi:hypothetical protein